MGRASVRGSQIYGCYLAIKTEALRLLDYCPNLEDEMNAHFIIWCLDRLEGLGMDPMLYQTERLKITDSPEYVVQITVVAEDGVDGSAEMFSGKTRAEACFLALLSALESTTQTDALAIPDSSSAAQSTAAEGEQEGGN